MPIAKSRCPKCGELVTVKSANSRYWYFECPKDSTKWKEEH